MCQTNPEDKWGSLKGNMWSQSELEFWSSLTGNQRIWYPSSVLNDHDLVRYRTCALAHYNVFLWWCSWAVKVEELSPREKILLCSLPSSKHFLCTWNWTKYEWANKMQKSRLQPVTISEPQVFVDYLLCASCSVCIGFTVVETIQRFWPHRIGSVQKKKETGNGKADKTSY